jgi:hypothetical protein
MNTKKLMIIIICCCFIFVSCRKIEGTQTENREYVIITIDGCQYIKPIYESSSTLTHKGNCNNPIHIYNKGGE